MAVLKTFQPSIFSALQYDRVTLNKSKVLLRHRDIHFLLADKALNDIDPNQVKQFIEPLSDIPNNLDAQFDDEQLSAFCQSRYIQQPSDIDNYVDALHNFTNQLTDYAKNLRRSVEDSSASVSSSSVSVDSKKTKEDATADD
jgi:hypothetical protein